MNLGEMRTNAFGKKWENAATKRFDPYMKTITIEANMAAISCGAGDDKYLITEQFELIANIGKVGIIMEATPALIKEVNAEAMDSREILRQLANDVTVTAKMLHPQLISMTKKIRESRQTVTIELNKSLTLMKDVRKFFLEKEYKVEMERLEKFVQIGERMHALIENGTMDAVCDVILKLSMQEG